MTRTPRRVAILGGNRIPFARSNGPYARASNQDMLTSTLDGLVARFGLAGEVVDEVIAGAVLKHARDFNLVRECVMGSALDDATAAFDVQQACDTGIQAAVLAANKIALRQIDVAIAGGVDTTSDAPLGVNDDLRRLLVEGNASTSTPERVKLLAHVRPSHLAPDVPRNAEPRTGLSMGEHAAKNAPPGGKQHDAEPGTGLSMGEHAAKTARVWNISREAQDELAVASHQRLAAAYDRGFFDDLVTPYLGLSRDQNLRPDSSLEKLAKLKPVFGAREDGATMTAANSTPLSDGASAVLMASEDWAQERRLPVLAYLTHSQTSAVSYVHGDEGLLMAPVYAVP